MTSFIDAAMGIEGIFSRRKYGVKLRLLYIGFMAVDSFQGRIGIYRDAVGTEPKHRPIKLVATIELEMSISFPGIVHRIPVCDSGE